MHQTPQIQLLETGSVLEMTERDCNDKTACLEDDIVSLTVRCVGVRCARSAPKTTARTSLAHPLDFQVLTLSTAQQRTQLAECLHISYKVFRT